MAFYHICLTLPSSLLSLTQSFSFSKRPTLSLALPASAVCLCCIFLNLFLTFLFSRSDLTEALSSGVIPVTLSPFVFFLFLSRGKSHTHQFAGSAPDERARKENINEAPQPINT